MLMSSAIIPQRHKELVDNIKRAFSDPPENYIEYYFDADKPNEIHIKHLGSGDIAGFELLSDGTYRPLLYKGTTMHPDAQTTAANIRNWVAYSNSPLFRWQK